MKQTTNPLPNTNIGFIYKRLIFWSVLLIVGAGIAAGSGKFLRAGRASGADIQQATGTEKQNAQFRSGAANESSRVKSIGGSSSDRSDASREAIETKLFVNSPAPSPEQQSNAQDQAKLSASHCRMHRIFLSVAGF